MLLKRTLLAALMFGASGTVHADQAWLEREDVRQFIEQSQHADVSRAQIEAAILEAQPKMNIVSLMDKPSTSRPWHQFYRQFATPEQIRNGAAFWRQHANILRQAEEKYGVPAQIIVSIIGVETRYGKMQGGFRVLDALATMAFEYPRRAEFFRSEFLEFLRLAQEEKRPPASFKGSYAGAMGIPQFMPSSFRKWAVDGNGDGQRDIWQTPHDAIFSVAHYLKEHGWQRGAPVAFAVSLAPDMQAESFLAHRFELKYRFKDWQKFGVQSAPNLQPEDLALLFALDFGDDVPRYYLGAQNFYTITRYNRSIHYAMTVYELGEAIKRAYLANESF